MDGICQMCGAIGFTDLLISCSKCNASAQHRYCLFNITDLIWTCEQCMPTFPSTHCVKVKEHKRYHLPQIDHAGCLQVDKSLSDQSMPEKDTIGDTSDACHMHSEASQGPELCIYPDSKTLKARIINMKRRRAVLDDEEGDVAHIHCDSLDLMGKKCMHAASKSHEGKMVKRKRKLILDDEDADELCFMKVAKMSSIKFGCPQSLESDCSNAKDSSAMRQCNNDSLDFKGDKLSKRRRQLVLDDLYLGEEDPHKLCFDVVSNVHKGSGPSVDLCSLRGGYCHSSSIVDGATLITESQAVPDSISCAPALPIIEPVWCGCFFICNGICLPIVAHLSSNACMRVIGGVRMIPSILCLDKKSILESLPDCFRKSRPTGERIALYFFPFNDSVRPLYDQILGDVIVHNIFWKVVLEEAELLIFPSTELLPGPYQKFQGKYYFWGVFRRKQAASYHVPSSSIASPKGLESIVRTWFMSMDAYLKEDPKPSDCVAAFMKDSRASSPHTWGSICDLVEVPIQSSSLNQSTPSTLLTDSTDSSPKTDLLGNLRLLCRSMDWKGLWDLIIASEKAELVTLKLHLPLLLKECTNPCGFVMDTMSRVFPHESISCTVGRNHEWACLLLLESLTSTMKMSQSSSMLLSATVGIQERARKIADSWKAARKKWLLKSKLTVPPYAHTFLVHVVTFGINVDEEKELYRTLLMSLSWKNDIHDLASPLGLGGETMISTIQELIDKGAVSHAINLIYGAGLVDRFHPVPLLKSQLAALERKDRKRKIHSLNSVIRCVQKHKLENELPLVPIQKLVKHLKDKGGDVMENNSATASKRNVVASDAAYSKRWSTTTRPARVAATIEKQTMVSRNFSFRSKTCASPATSTKYSSRKRKAPCKSHDTKKTSCPTRRLT